MTRLPRKSGEAVTDETAKQAQPGGLRDLRHRQQALELHMASAETLDAPGCRAGAVNVVEAHDDDASGQNIEIVPEVVVCRYTHELRRDREVVREGAAIIHEVRFVVQPGMRGMLRDDEADRIGR